MKKIDSIVYNYVKSLQQQQAKLALQQQLAYIDQLLTFDKQHFIKNSAQIIYEEICSLIPAKLKHLIYQEDFINTKTFNEYANKFLNTIILQSNTKQTFEDQNSNVMKIINKTFESTCKKIDLLQQNRLKNLNNILQEGIWDSIKAGAAKVGGAIKKIGSAIWEGLKKLGQAIFNFFKAVYEYIKIGFSMITKLFKGKSGYSEVSQIYDDYNKMDQCIVDGLPFLKSSIDKSQESANSNPDAEKAEETMEKTLAEGGDVDKLVKQQSKTVGKKAADDTKAQIQTNGKKQAGKFNQKLKEQKKNPKKQDNTQKLILEKNNTYSINEKLIQENFSTKIIKEAIIQLAFHGLTPKAVIQEMTGKSYGEYQNDIIVNNSKLSFKTHNGQLICEQINLNTNETIIYQTNTEFIGNHLIFEQTSGTYKKSNIISEQKKAIIYEMNAILWVAVIIGSIIAIYIIFQLLKQALLWLIRTATVGISAAFDWVVSKFSKPGENHGAGGVTRALFKNTIKHAGQKASKEVLTNAGKKAGTKAVQQAAKKASEKAIADATAAAAKKTAALAVGTTVAGTTAAAGGVVAAVDDANQKKEKRIQANKEYIAANSGVGTSTSTPGTNDKVLLPSFLQ